MQENCQKGSRTKKETVFGVFGEKHERGIVPERLSSKKKKGRQERGITGMWGY